MSTRADQTHSDSRDPDSTDQLPALDIAAFETARGVASNGRGNADTRRAPAAPTATPDGGEPAIFDTIRSLEANLHAKSERTADLEQLLARAERERETAERRLRERDQVLARLELELEARTAALSRAEQQAQEAGEAQRNAERQARTTDKDKIDLLSRLADLEEIRLGLAADAEARGETITRFKGDLATRAEQVRRLEQQRDALDVGKAALADTLQARDARLAFLDAEIAARDKQIKDMEHFVAGRDETIRRLRNEIEQAHGEARATQEELAERETRIAALDAQLRDKEEARLEMARELQEHAHNVIAAEEAVRASERQVQSCIEALQSLEVRRNLYENELFVREQEISRQLVRVSALEADMGRHSGDLDALQTQLHERDSVIRELTAEIATRDVTLNEHASELERLRAASHDFGGLIADLQRLISTHAAEIARLQGDLAERDTRIEKGVEDLRNAAAQAREREQEQITVKSAMDALRAQLAERGDELASLAALLQTEQSKAAGLENDLAMRTRSIAELETRCRMQSELTDAHTRELDTWKEKWSDIATAVGEKEARVGQMETDLRVKIAEVATRSERITTLQKTVDDQAETLTALEKELRDKAESIARLEGDLRAAEDSMLRLESQLRQRSDQSSIAQRTLEEQRGQIRHLQDTLATRDSAVARLEGELKASSEIIGNIQRDIRRLSAEAPKSEPVSRPEAFATPASEPVTRLLVRLDGEAEIVHVINKKSTAIGRTDDNDIQIDTKYISRHHARIVIASGTTVVEDLGSTNGVFINDCRITRQALHDGDTLMIGKTQFRFAVKSGER
jgi:chromosome segregation ATPase